MKIFVVNSGSSSLKYQLIDIENQAVLARGLCERIGIDNSFVKHNVPDREPVIIEKDLYNHKVALEEVIRLLTAEDTGVVKSLDEISAVGHRVVHGGEKFRESVLINDDVMEAIQSCVELAPLHNPANITGIEACRQLMPDKPQVAVFDTAFHQTMPKYAYLYALPYEIYEKYGVRKYGFHGTSHKYVAERAAIMLGRPLEELYLITCHLGNGASVCAIKKGKSVDTSMGFTPLAGLAMGTRSGTIDPAVISFLMEKENLTISQINENLNKKSGILGISGISSDFRDVIAAAEKGNERAQLAIDIFCYRVKKYSAEYMGVLNGADGIVFTAGIGENNALIRELIVKELDYLGIELDPLRNDVRGEERIISKDSSKIKLLVIPTNEELAIAKETAKFL